MVTIVPCYLFDAGEEKGRWYKGGDTVHAAASVLRSFK